MTGAFEPRPGFLNWHQVEDGGDRQIQCVFQPRVFVVFTHWAWGAVIFSFLRRAPAQTQTQHKEKKKMSEETGEILVPDIEIAGRC